MRISTKKTTSLLLALIMVALTLPCASAATGDYTKNSEPRHTDCTYLSDQAMDYYSKEVNFTDSSASSVYSYFMDLSKAEENDSSNSFNAIKGDAKKFANQPVTNSLFAELNKIMTDTHTHGTSYAGYAKNALATHWLSTDTSGGSDKEFYTFFYADTEANSSAVMQREHIWPKSRASFYMATGLGGSDLHHLRPAVDKVNNKKSNWAFGDHTGHKVYRNNIVQYGGQPVLWKFVNENGDTCIDVKEDVRGDVARILLYVYVRWVQPNLYTDLDDAYLPELDADDDKNTGLKVVESLDTLLDWCEKDPVDTWEMSRNDITESIQGNRNVFIDYPELAWLLFDKTVPDDMTTPSGMAKASQDDITVTESAPLSDPITVNFENRSTTAYNGETDISAYYLDNDGDKVYIKSGQQVEKDTEIHYSITVNTDETEFTQILANGTSTANKYKVTDYTISEEDGPYVVYTFTKKADSLCVDDTLEGTNDTEDIYVCSKSKVCELYFKYSSSSGTHSGTYYASYTDETGKEVVLENGSVVKNGTSFNMKVVPDCTSIIDHVSTTATKNTENILHDGTHEYSFTADCSSGSHRKKNITITWGVDHNITDGLFGTGHYRRYMKSQDDDDFYEYAQFIQNFEITGVQIKADESNSIRFVSVINSSLLKAATEYGYLVATTKKKTSDEAMTKGYELYYDNPKASKIICTDTDNKLSGAYGKHIVDKENPDTAYKYITLAIEDIPDAETDTIFIVRPYAKLAGTRDGEDFERIIYGDYLRTTEETYNACAASYNQIIELAQQ